MKKLLLFFIACIISYNGILLAQNAAPADTAANPPAATPPQQPESDTTDTAGANTTTASPGTGAVNENAACGCIPKPDAGQPTTAGWVLVFAPVLLFIVLGAGLFTFVKGFNFKEALAENAVPKYTIANPQYAHINEMITTAAAAQGANINLNDIVPPTVDVSILPPEYTAPTSPVEAPVVNTPPDNFRASISRYIAFFSGMLTVIIAVCMASFFIYYYIHTSCPPDLSALSTVLIALGIGVTPYAVNKVSGALAARKPED